MVKLWLSAPLVRWGIADLWTALSLPGPETALFKTGFKVSVGLVMALGYAIVREPRLPGSRWSKALVYAVLIWLVNALVVLPALDEGIAERLYLTLGGMAPSLWRIRRFPWCWRLCTRR